ncbi:MAG TPA: sulfite exporter TauE/SafE family protein [Chloroflexi bacterium]|nr:sulfite exporter TauE/SafE family protein [Chloroflexota bacterium]
MVLSIIYLVLLLSIGTLVFLEGFRATRLQVHQRMDAGDMLTLTALSRRTQRLHLPPMVSLPASGISSISLWAVLAVGLVTGFLAGLLGVGGGFIRVPALIYLLGVPTHVAVGTDLFEIVFSAGYGTLTHALKGNVDILMALVMQVGAAVGAYLGALATRYISGPRLRIAFAFLPFIGAALLLVRLFHGGFVK